MVFSEDTIGGFFEKQVEAQGDREFLVYPDRDLRFTYKEFNERVNMLAKGLLSIGIEKGDHVGIWAKNVPDWLTFLFATAKIGAVLVTVNTAYKSHELDYILKQSDMKALAIIDGFRDINYIKTIYDLVPELKKHPRGRLNSSEYPHLKSVIYVGQEKHRGMYNTNELMLLGKHQSDDELNKVKATLDNNEVINMQYTSGTTGFPKGVMLTHRNILNNGHGIGHRMKFTEEDRLCIPVPLFHCFGIVLGVLAILTHGGTMVMVELFDPLLVLSAIQKEKCTAVHGVPTMFIAELTHPMFDMFDMSSLRTGIMAGSTCPIETMKEVMDKMNMTEITSVYGLTESSPGMTQSSADDSIERKANTVGVAFDDVEVRIIDPDTNIELKPGETGEICCKGYNVMKGYYKMPDKTKEVIDDDGWLHSGDLATVDEEGYYTIVGRKKDMIIRGGENIYPREIEEFLYTIDGVQDAQVAGIADEKYGEIVGAFVIKEEGSCLEEEDIRDYALEKIARYKVPKHVFFVGDFPLTASGKVQKFKLSELGLKLVKEKEKEMRL
ncbi:AMP-binding protein [Methanobrevibacter arboriphilus]|jgi:fatty-acyl-CoA synthase|uniref:AMP-binding protein n=1 Tax=Methanobrevibacter arboriphilus TaxID=39441 RepID=A0ACA8R1T5_METAZ|nr:AMP-binding protein [Methanobrevibacter arboriphilus]MCC7562505.1 AMP-binding protein [Methanobrevibacter arboriphilus]BBL61231.1 AMP-binding protein [Methanobrevibacter arboriphilus]GLI11436.1 AMP-binding protein [Methanobrevibacter arboriphilus]